VATPYTIYLVSCVAKKRDHSAPAQDLYTSEWFRRARAYVERTGSRWFILSAQHGLVNPDQVIAPYNRTLNKMNIEERRTWALRVQRQLEDLELPAGVCITLFAGERYREFLMDYLLGLGQVDVPMARLRLGEQLNWLGLTASVGRPRPL
jgi:hypothetical protein